MVLLTSALLPLAFAVLATAHPSWSRKSVGVQAHRGGLGNFPPLTGSEEIGLTEHRSAPREYAVRLRLRS